MLSSWPPWRTRREGGPGAGGDITWSTIPQTLGGSCEITEKGYDDGTARNRRGRQRCAFADGRSLCVRTTTHVAQADVRRLSGNSAVVCDLRPHHRLRRRSGARLGEHVPPDGVFIANGQTNGTNRAELAAFIKAVHDDPTYHNRHWMANLRLTPTAEGVTGSVYVLVLRGSSGSTAPG